MDSASIHTSGAACESLHMGDDFWTRLVESFADCGLPASQTAIARALGVGQSAVNKWATGGGTPTHRRCAQIAMLTGVNVDWLITGRGVKKNQGGVMDELTKQLMERWIDLPADAKREVLAFVNFKSADQPEPHVFQPDQKPTSK